MNPPAPTTVVAEINRLYDEAQRLATVSRVSLQAALAAAWSAGRLLLEEKKRVRRLIKTLLVSDAAIDAPGSSVPPHPFHER